MLADAATVERGKLYVHGGGWDKVTVGEVPATHPTMALVLVFKVEYDEALQDRLISIRLVDEDNNQAGPEINGVLNVGHPPRSKLGAPTFVPQAITVQQIEFTRTGRFRFLILADEGELGSVPFEVQRKQGGQKRPPAKEV